MNRHYGEDEQPEATGALLAYVVMLYLPCKGIQPTAGVSEWVATKTMVAMTAAAENVQRSLAKRN